MKTSLLLALLALAAMPALAADKSPMTPGLWQVSVQMQMPGMPYQMGPHTARQCITAAMLKENGGVPQAQLPPDMQCKTTHQQRSSNSMDWSVSCSGNATVQGRGSMTWDTPVSYHGQMHMTMDVQGHHTDMEQAMQGKRLGDCK